MANWKKLASGAAGAAGGDVVNVEDVFSIDTFEGTGSNVTITNGIDIATEGGLSWGKDYNNSNVNWYMSETENGGGYYNRTDDANKYQTYSTAVTFNTNGVTLGSGLWPSGRDNVHYTMRKHPHFLDIVNFTTSYNYTSTVTHNLESDLGAAIFFKVSGDTQGYNNIFWHKSRPNNYYRLNQATSFLDDVNEPVYNSSTKTFTFPYTMNDLGDRIVSGGSEYSDFVGVFFADNNGNGVFGPTGDQDIIKCGQYSGSGSTFQEVNVGFEPDFVMIKHLSASTSFLVFDTRRHFNGNPVYQAKRLAFDTADQQSSQGIVYPSANGFTFNEEGSYFLNASGANYIYIAIRKGPMAVPESSSDVFEQTTATSTGSTYTVAGSLYTDFAMSRTTGNSGQYTWFLPRKAGRLHTQSNQAEYSNYEQYINLDNEPKNSGVAYKGWFGSYTGRSYHWKSAPQFFETQLYKGTGANRTVDHNLGVTPEMIWVKARDLGTALTCYHKGAGNTHRGEMHSSSAFATSTATWNNTTPTDSVFTVGFVGAVNASGYDYVAYLFSSLDGISKVGSYTGNGSTQNIDCGFSNGAKWVMVKRTDNVGNWFVFDTISGINSGYDPFWAIDDTAALNSSNDYIDPYSGGFAPVSLINESGGNYIFYAIAA